MNQRAPHPHRPPKRSGATRGTRVILSTTAILDALGIGLVMPVLPALLAGHVSAAHIPVLTGALTALYAITQLFFAPLLGVLSDRFGRRRVLLASLLGASLDAVIMACSPVLWVLFLGRAVAGVTGATGAVLGSAVADTTPAEQRARAYGVLGACAGAGMIAGPALGGLLGSISATAPFWGTAILNAAAFSLALITLKETRPMGKGTQEIENTRAAFSLRSALRWVRQTPQLGTLVLLYTVLQLIGHLPGSLWVLFTVHRYEWSSAQIGLSLAAFGLTQVLAQGALTGRLTGALGERGTILLAAAADALGFAALALVPASWIALPILLLALGGVGTPALHSLISRAVDPTEQGRANGILTGASSLSGILGPLTFTACYAAMLPFGDGWVWVIGILLYLASLPVLFRIPLPATLPASGGPHPV